MLGGIAFSLDCTTNGGTANTAITLGTGYANTSDLRIYKRSGTDSLVDITDQVSLSNDNVSGTTRTVIRYTLIDGGSLDEDGLANGTIVDPIYVGVVAGTATATGSLASTGLNLYVVIGAASILAVGALAVILRQRRSIRRVSFRQS